jgi:hypothetical protein
MIRAAIVMNSSFFEIKLMILYDGVPALLGRALGSASAYKGKFIEVLWARIATDPG